MFLSSSMQIIITRLHVFYPFDNSDVMSEWNPKKILNWKITRHWNL